MAFHEWDDGPSWRTMWERQGQTVLVTGAHTALGAKVIDRLANSGWTVRILVDSSQLHQQYPRRIIPVLGSLDDRASMVEIVRDCRAVVHLQERQATRNPQQFVHENIEHTRTLVQVAREVHVAQFIFLSSASVAHRRGSPYSHSKKIAEDVVRGSGLEWTIVRPSMLVGIEGGLEYQSLRKIIRRFVGIPLPEGGHAVKRPLHEDDLAEGIDLLMRASLSSINRRTYHLSGQKSITVVDLVHQISTEHGWPKRATFNVPSWVCWWAARLVDRIFQWPYPASHLLRVIMDDEDHDNEPASHDFGFRPRPLSGRLIPQPTLDHWRHIAKPAMAPIRMQKGFSIIRRNTR